MSFVDSGNVDKKVVYNFQLVIDQKIRNLLHSQTFYEFSCDHI